jgi:hypothetical protein
MVQTPHFRTDEQRFREYELRRTAEVVRRERPTTATRTGRTTAAALRAISAALTRTANALDTPPDGLERDVRVIDRV